MGIRCGHPTVPSHTKLCVMQGKLEADRRGRWYTGVEGAHVQGGTRGRVPALPPQASGGGDGRGKDYTGWSV